MSRNSAASKVKYTEHTCFYQYMNLGTSFNHTKPSIRIRGLRQLIRGEVIVIAQRGIDGRVRESTLKRVDHKRHSGPHHVLKLCTSK